MNTIHNLAARVMLAMKIGLTSPSICATFGFSAMCLILASYLAAQDPSMPGMQTPQQHTHAATRGVEVEYPRMGRAQANAKGGLFTLDAAVQAARENNPTLRQAESGVKAARARAQQAGLYPNPTVGYSGDEIRGGEINGGKQGFFVEQRIVTAGKLPRAREVMNKDTKLAEIEAEEQKVRVETAVKMAFYRVLAAQEMADAREDLARIAEQTVESVRRLQNSGQRDETEVLAAEVEAQRMQLAARKMENTLREEWRSLVAIMGQPELRIQAVAGDLESGWPALDELQVVENVATQSPAVRIASASGERAEAALARAKRERIPDITARVGLEYNHELLNGIPLSTGWQGNAQLGVELPIFNRNQGNIAAAREDIARAGAEKQRVTLTLRERAAAMAEQYANARLMAQQYRDGILPLAKKSYALMSDRYGEMQAAYPRVLESKQKLFELQTEYIGALGGVWTTGLALEGYLLTDGLEAPTLPGEMNRTIRETNVPMPERLRFPSE
jgi:cobalt-zinc-cadmium efflux system outer membrane protein